jgi:hypothetical protein
MRITLKDIHLVTNLDQCNNVTHFPNFVCRPKDNNNAPQREWTRRRPGNFGAAVHELPPPLTTTPPPPLPADCQSPYDYYKLFVDDAFVDRLVRASQQRAIGRGRPKAASQITQDSLLTALGVLHMMGYVSMGRWDAYWSKSPATGREIVKAAIRAGYQNFA